ncbi:MAG: hypothetical protein ABH870_06375 [bacterium]
MRYYARSGESTTLEIGTSNDPDDHIALMPSGNVGIGTTDPKAKLHVNGSILADNLRANNIIGMGPKSGYVADHFINKLGKSLEQGDVVIIGKNQVSLYYGMNNNIPIPEVDLSDTSYDTRICGIVDGVSLIDIEEAPEEQEKEKKKKGKAVEKEEVLDKTKVGPNQKGLMVTLGAYAHCKVDADIASIEVGDLLTTSTTPGHAQKVLDKLQGIGAIIGKALAPLEKGKGKIPVLVMLQ